VLHSCDVDNCEDTSATLVEKAEKSKRKDERYSCMTKMDASRSSTSRRFYSSMSSASCSVPASKTPVMNTYD
ncbi:unnamed protein product, partial [Pocillopora meandrina]